MEAQIRHLIDVVFILHHNFELGSESKYLENEGSVNSDISPHYTGTEMDICERIAQTETASLMH